MSPLIFIGFGIVLVGSSFGVSYWLEKKRTEAIERFAALNGFTIAAPANLDAWSTRFKLFGQGRSHRYSHVMYAQKSELNLILGDFTYVTGSGKNQRSHVQTFCLAQKPNTQKPNCFARRQNVLFDKVGKLFGGQDINFEEDSDFSKAFVLQTEDNEDNLRRHFGPLIRNQLVSMRNKNVQFEAQGDLILIHRGTRLKDTELNEFLADVVNTARAWFT